MHDPKSCLAISATLHILLVIKKILWSIFMKIYQLSTCVIKLYIKPVIKQYLVSILIILAQYNYIILLETVNKIHSYCWIYFTVYIKETKKDFTEFRRSSQFLYANISLIKGIFQILNWRKAPNMSNSTELITIAKFNSQIWPFLAIDKMVLYYYLDW